MENIAETRKCLNQEWNRLENKKRKTMEYARERAARAYIEQCHQYDRLSWWDYLGLISMAVIVSYCTVLLIVR